MALPSIYDNNKKLVAANAYQNITKPSQVPYQIRLATDATNDIGSTKSRLSPPMYVLKYPPSEFSISEINNQYSQIERTGGAPLTDFTKYPLAKVSFNFVIGNDDLGDITEDLKILRALATPNTADQHRHSPIIFYGFPQIFSLLFNTPGVRSLPYWRIENMGVNIQARGTDSQNKLMPTRATIDMSIFQDNPSFLKTVVIPKVKYKPPPPPPVEKPPPGVPLFWHLDANGRAFANNVVSTWPLSLFEKPPTKVG